jgi:GntR family transcriptional regulator
MLNDLLSVRKINKDLPVPFYYQIAQILREGVRDAMNASEDEESALPSESELCEIFQVNRGTIRHALDQLEHEGLIYREKGRGTFIRRRRLELDLSALCSTTEDLKARGWIPGTIPLEVSQITPRPHIRTNLQLAEGQMVWKIYRLRLANQEPISLQWAYVPAALVPGLDQKDVSGSLYYTLKNSYGIELRTADEIIRTRLATIEEASLLEIKEGDPVFDINRTSYDASGRAVEYLESLWRGDRYDFRVRMSNRG